MQKFGPFKVHVPEGQQWDPAAKRSVMRPAVDGWVFVEVDPDRLVASLGRRAILNTGGRAVEAGGAVVVRKVAQ